jgi:hypothetical protein
MKQQFKGNEPANLVIKPNGDWGDLTILYEN